MGWFSGKAKAKVKVIFPKRGSAPTNRIMEFDRLPVVGEQIQIRQEDTDTPTENTLIYEVAAVVWDTVLPEWFFQGPFTMQPILVTKFIHEDTYDSPYGPGVVK